MSTTNPFLALVGPTVTQQEQPQKAENEIMADTQVEVGLEHVLRLSVHRDRPKCVYLPGLAEAKQHLSVEKLNEAIFERLMMEPSDLAKTRSESRLVMYLYGCYQRSYKSTLPENVNVALRKVIIEQSATCLMNEPIYPGPPTVPHNKQLELLVLDERSVQIADFLRQLGECVDARFKAGGEEVTLKQIVAPTFAELARQLKGVSILSTKVGKYLEVVRLFAQNEPLALSLLANEPTKAPTANPGPLDELVSVSALQNSLLGCFFNISILGSDEPMDASWGFFERGIASTMQDISIEENNLWTPLRLLVEDLFLLINQLLRVSPAVRSQVVEWVGYALQVSTSRGKLGRPVACLSHGFAMNLCAVLLKLSKPFCQIDHLKKVLKADFGYSAFAYDGEKIRLRGMEKETTLLPRADVKLEKQSNFPSECFFSVQRAILLGHRVIHERMVDMNKDMGKLRSMLEDAREQTLGPQAAPFTERLEKQFGVLIGRYQCMRTVVFEPDFFHSLINFVVCSAHWLVQVATDTALSPVPAHDRLSLVPEYVLENISDTVILTKRFAEKSLRNFGDHLPTLLTLVTTFMGSSDRVNNPHLRAKLAEMLEALIIRSESDGSNPSICNSTVRNLLEQSVSQELSETLINVFVSIEMSGQSVSFEEKFQYRRPMYIVLEQLWQVPLHRSHMEGLCSKAAQGMELASQPLFLRFVNLLINDANFLLDESFQYMNKLKQLEKERPTWTTLPFDRRQQNEGNFRHQGLLARFHNVMARETINTLTWLTSSETIRHLFVHPVLVDRIATMLNFFLFHLVGPEQKNLRVQNLSEYEFKPARLAENISQIYLHLSGTDAFYEAVCRDERSYKPELFTEAQKVLDKIGKGVLGIEIEQLGRKVASVQKALNTQDELNQDAPQEFMDPLLVTLMTDPVILPTSGVTCDRNTIARHLLSDQTDPFNRQPLSLEQVRPDTELKAKIDKWLKENKSNR